MRLVASAHARLSQPNSVRIQMLAQLFITRVHNSIKSSYEHYLASAAKSLPCGQHPLQMDTQLERTRRSETYQRQNEIVEEPQRRRETIAPTRLTHRKLRRFKNVEPESTDRAPSVERKWDWRAFPNRWRPLVIYDWFSTFWMSFAGLRTIFQRQLNDLVDPLSRWLLNGRPGQCLLMGRLAKPFMLSELTTVFVAYFHLCWRATQARARRGRLITLVIFLLASDRDLDRAYATLDCDRRRPPSEDDTDQETRWSHSIATSSQPSSAFDETGYLFRQVMCYPVHRNQRVYFRLRPNRTREACKLLRGRMAAVSLFTLIFFACGFSIASCNVLICILSDYRYARTYPGCTPELDERLARGELTYFSSFTLRDHHLLSALVDLVENTIFWLDSSLAIRFMIAFLYLLNYDLTLYWSALNRKLESLAQRSKHVYLSRLDRSFHRPDVSPPSLPCRHRRLESMRQLESDIHELQFEMYDFFDQVRRADMIIGEILTIAILVWLSGCAFVNYNLLKYNVSSRYMSLVVELILILGFSLLSLATYYLLELRRCCLKSYRALCSLMAYDQTRKKRSFIKLIDFYLGARNSTTYHLCRTFAYEPTTFITIIGWTFSCFFIAFTLFTPYRNPTVQRQLESAHSHA